MVNFVINWQVDWLIFTMFFVNASVAAFPIGIAINGVFNWIKAGPSLDC